MRLSAVSLLFYRPLFKASDLCFEALQGFYQKIRAPILDQPLAKSIVGRLALCASAEFAWGVAGSYVGEAALRPIGTHLLPVAVRCIIPVSAAVVLYSARSKTAKVALLVLAGTTLVNHSASLEQLSQWGASAGAWLGKNMGMILGGYAGLIFTQCDVPFWDHAAHCDAYSVGMAKYVVAGQIFDSVVLSSTIPYLGPLFNIPRNTIGLVVKSAAYNSNIDSQHSTSRKRCDGLHFVLLFPSFLRSTFHSPKVLSSYHS